MRFSAFAGAVVLCVMLLGPSIVAGAAAPLTLIVPQDVAFSYLGHSCGGIQEHTYGTGWDASGYPTGYAFLSTRCGGSGRGGGYKSTTYRATIAVTWDFAGGIVSTAPADAPTVDPTFSTTDANGDQLYNAAGLAYLVVAPVGAPAVVGVVQVGDQFQVTWTTSLVDPLSIISSTITATPVNSGAPVLTATTTGSGTTGLIGPLQPSTSYQISVVNNYAGGSSTPSIDYPATTAAATIRPLAPANVVAHWSAPSQPGDQLVVSWDASDPGNSPVDSYLVVVSGSDRGGLSWQNVPGTTLTASFSVSDTPDWTISVWAHNAAGWSPASTRFTLGGT